MPFKRKAYFDSRQLASQARIVYLFPMKLTKNLKLEETLRNELAKAALLYMLIERKADIDKDLTGANRALKEIIADGENDLWELEKKVYIPTRKGELIWENWKARWWDFKVNYDIFAGVDLLNGEFAGPDADFDAIDENGNLIWEDLRVAVCIRKIQLAKKEGKKTALNPCTITFLSLLSEGRLDDSREWQFDIAFESIFWNEIENIVNSNIWPEELGYEDVSWEEVMDDIIVQGTEESKNRWSEDYFDKQEGYTPSRGFTNEKEVVEEYSEDLVAYPYPPGYFTYTPHWGLGQAAMTAGAIGLCWMLF